MIHINKSSDRYSVLEALKIDGTMLQYASDELRNDKEIVLESLKKNISNLIYASNELKDSKEFVLEILKKDGFSINFILSCCSDKCKKDKDIVLAAFEIEWRTIENIPEVLLNDREFLMQMLIINKEATLMYFSTRKYINNKNFNNKWFVLETAELLEVNPSKLITDNSTLLKNTEILYASLVSRFKLDSEYTDIVLNNLTEEQLNNKRLAIELINYRSNLFYSLSPILKADNDIKTNFERIEEEKKSLLNFDYDESLEYSHQFFDPLSGSDAEDYDEDGELGYWADL